MAIHGQHFEDLVIVASKVVGGKDDSTPKADPRTAPKTADGVEAVLMKRLG